MSARVDVDIAIVGGGIVGLLLARLVSDLRVAGRPLRVALVEPRPPVAALPGEDLDLRVSALSPASLRVLDAVGCMPLLPAQALSSYERMCVWQGDAGPGVRHTITFSAAELGASQLGAVAENRALRLALWTLLESRPDCLLLQQETVAVREEQDSCVLQLDTSEVYASLVVAADGTRSRVRELLGIDWQERSFGANALVTHLQSTRPHASTAWQKFLPGGPAALLPLADGRVSLVWSHPQEQSEELLALDDDQFAARLSAELGYVLGDLTCTTGRATFPLASAHAGRYTGRRYALVGDAAHRIHPLAGQGANLGIADVAALAQALQAHLAMPCADPGDPLVLRRYERARKGDNAVTLGAMVGLDGLFRSALADMAGAGMGLVDRSGPMKALLARYAMGA